MKRKFNELFNSTLIGMGFGMPTTIICMILIGGYKPFFKEFIVWMIASALFGIVSNIFFSNERLGFFVAMLLNFVSCFVITIVAGAICGYADSILSLIIGIAPIFIVSYLIICGISFLSMKLEEKKINKALRNKE